MKKSNFVALVLGTVSLVLFALGMCMALLPEWNLFKTGIVFGSVGIFLGLITIFVWRKMEHKTPIKLNIKTIGLTIYIILALLALGTGMSLCLTSGQIVIGTLIGLLGIVMLLFLIPICKGLK